MTAAKTFGIKASLVAAALAFTMSSAWAVVDVAGVKYQDSVNVAGKDLVLNGAGVRTKLIFKVYTAGLYLQAKEATADGVMKSDGPRRMRLVMLRDVSSEEFGGAFMAGLNANVSSQDKSRIVSQISKYGEMFAALPGLKKGDTLDTDYIPGVGSQSFLNGKKVGGVLPDVVFNNSVLRIWLGEKPVDGSLKTKLLAAAPAK
jgi:hypothetical protein